MPLCQANVNMSILNIASKKLFIPYKANIFLAELNSSLIILGHLPLSLILLSATTLALPRNSSYYSLTHSPGLEYLPPLNRVIWG